MLPIKDIAFGLALAYQAFGIEPPLPTERFMLCETYTHTVQPYAYGTEKHTIRVRMYVPYVCVWYVPYVYGMKYACCNHFKRRRICMYGGHFLTPTVYLQIL